MSESKDVEKLFLIQLDLIKITFPQLYSKYSQGSQAEKENAKKMIFLKLSETPHLKEFLIEVLTEKKSGGDRAKSRRRK